MGGVNIRIFTDLPRYVNRLDEIQKKETEKDSDLSAQMCIRDSIMEAFAARDIDVLVSTTVIEAVSYTHLDVYKRQQYGRRSDTDFHRTGEDSDHADAAEYDHSGYCKWR